MRKKYSVAEKLIQSDIRYNERVRIASAVLGNEFKQRPVTLSDIYSLLEIIQRKLTEMEAAGLISK